MIFCFFKQKTAYEMRISDWSSDVCSSDLVVKVLADKRTDKVLGVHIVGPLAGDILAECVTVMEFGGTAEDIARTCHAHPSMGESVKEAALAVDGRPIHICQRRPAGAGRSEEHTSELQSLMSISYAVFCLTTKNK